MRNSDESEDIYERLVDALDALPHGFPRTPSSVELRLIKMAFTPEEVSLAGHLSRTPETAAEIANRVGLDVADVSELLEALIPRRLVRLDSPGMAAPGLTAPVVGEKKYRLGPFLVGWYEAMMRLLDREFAELFEQYVTEGGGERILSPRPGSLGVVPVRGSLKPEQMKVMEPHLDIDAHFARHERFIVIDCVCKREQELLGQCDCPMPMKRCGFVGLPPQTRCRKTYSAEKRRISYCVNSRKWGMSTSQYMDSPWEPRPLSSSARAIAAIVAAGLSTWGIAST